MNISFSRIMWLELCNNARFEWLTKFRDDLNEGGATVLGIGAKEMSQIEADYLEMKKLLDQENGAVILGKTSLLPQINEKAEKLLSVLDGGVAYEVF